MPRAHIVRQVDIERTARLAQMESMFDVAPSERSREEWDVDLPLEGKEWNVGLIVGPSGCGKTTVAREFWPDAIVEGYDWPKDRSVIDGFPRQMGTKEITRLLNSVGFSSPPSWIRPFRVLSNGEQFRATIARALAENHELVVLDEFTSVVDRTVAKIGSTAISKTVKKRGQKFIAVSCHYDIAEWLEPDWMFEPHEGRFQWVHLQRPRVQLEIRRVHSSAWELFKKHHYLTAKLNPVARCYVGFIWGIPVAFFAILPFPHASAPGWRGHRLVTLPDYQGIGVGNIMCKEIASMVVAMGHRFRVQSTHPALTASRMKSPDYRLIQRGLRNPRGKTSTTLTWDFNCMRGMWSFEYIGPKMDAKEAIRLWGSDRKIVHMSKSHHPTALRNRVRRALRRRS